MRHDRQSSSLPLDEAAPTKSEIERSVVIVRASILLGRVGTFAGLSADEIRSITCASLGADIRHRSPEYVAGIFDTLVERQQPRPRHDSIPA